MAKYKEKFIVINTKFLDKLNKEFNKTDNLEYDFIPSPDVYKLSQALRDIKYACHKLGIDLSKKNYYVCNQDEPYAQQVIDIILNGEDEKARQIE